MPHGVMEIFHWHKTFWSHYGPGVYSASKKMSTRSISWGVNAAGAYGWQPYHRPVPLTRNLGNLNSWNPLGNFRPVTGQLYLYLYMKLCIFDPLSLNSETLNILFSKPIVIRPRYIQKLLPTTLYSNTLILCPSLKASSKFPYTFGIWGNIKSSSEDKRSCTKL
jgi:hypothetical protein